MQQDSSFCKSKKLYQCPLCKFKSSVLRNVQDHMRSYHEDYKDTLNLTATNSNYQKIYTWKCKYCKFESIMLRNVQDHMRKNHHNKLNQTATTSNNQIIYKCKLCKFMSSVELNVQDHMRSYHEDHEDAVNLTANYQIIYKCKLCKFMSSVEQNVQDHMISYHEDHEDTVNLTANYQADIYSNTSEGYTPQISNSDGNQQTSFNEASSFTMDTFGNEMTTQSTSDEMDMIALHEILQFSNEGIVECISFGEGIDRTVDTDVDSVINQIHVDPPPGGFLQISENHNVD